MNEIKKAQEFIILDNFRQSFPEFPKGKLIKSESPDFILKTSPKYSIGIELTALPSLTYTITKKSISTFIIELQISIAKKEEKLKIYQKKRANEYWLIIFADSIISQGINLNNHIEKLPVYVNYERIFLFTIFESKICELRDQKSDK